MPTRDEYEASGHLSDEPFPFSVPQNSAIAPA